MLNESSECNNLELHIGQLLGFLLKNTEENTDWQPEQEYIILPSISFESNIL